MVYRLSGYYLGYTRCWGLYIFKFILRHYRSHPSSSVPAGLHLHTKLIFFRVIHFQHGLTIIFFGRPLAHLSILNRADWQLLRVRASVDIERKKISPFQLRREPLRDGTQLELLACVFSDLLVALHALKCVRSGNTSWACQIRFPFYVYPFMLLWWFLLLMTHPHSVRASVRIELRNNEFTLKGIR